MREILDEPLKKNATARQHLKKQKFLTVKACMSSLVESYKPSKFEIQEGIATVKDTNTSSMQIKLIVWVFILNYFLFSRIWLYFWWQYKHSLDVWWRTRLQENKKQIDEKRVCLLIVLYRQKWWRIKYG